MGMEPSTSMVRYPPSPKLCASGTTVRMALTERSEFIAMMTGGGKLPEQNEPQSANSDKSIEDVIDQS